MVTITGTYEALTGGGGSGYVVATLLNYGSNVPRVAGTGIIVSPTLSTGISSTFALSLYGNDVILPGGTYYEIAFYSVYSGFVAGGLYQLVGSGTYDISALTPYVPTPVTPPTLVSMVTTGPSSTVQAAGVVNGVNCVYSFTATTSTPPIMVFAAGIFQVPSIDYNLYYLGSSVWEVTFNTAPTYGPVSIVAI